MLIHLRFFPLENPPNAISDSSRTHQPSEKLGDLNSLEKKIGTNEYVVRGFQTNNEPSERSEPFSPYFPRE